MSLRYTVKEYEMDIKTIEENINIFENEDITPDNALKLASLYIIRQNLTAPLQTMVDAEFHDILPGYNNYVETLSEFQRGKVQEEAVYRALSLLCHEIQEFLQVLYSSTNCYKERLILINTVQTLYQQFSK